MSSIVTLVMEASLGLAMNVSKFLVDIPFYVHLFASVIIASLLNCVPRTRKKFNSSDILLVTGAASGLGQKVVWNLTELFPETVYVLWDIDEKGLLETQDKCRELGAVNVFTYVVDLTRREDVVKTAALVKDQVGRVTVLWNNAGVSPYQKFVDVDAITEEGVIRVNLLSHMWTIREFLPDMIDMDKGHIATTCSGLAFFRWSHLSSYCASKYGLLGFLETLQLEMRQHPSKPNIKFSTIYPGFVKTPMLTGVSWEPRYNIPGLTLMDVEYVTRAIVDGILKDKKEIMIPGSIRAAYLFYRFLPTALMDGLDKHLFRNFTITGKAKCLNHK